MYVQRNIEVPSRIIVTVEKERVLLIGVCVCVRVRVRTCGYPGAWACARA